MGRRRPPDRQGVERMDRDESPPADRDSLLPPSRPGYELTVGLVGAGLCALAAAVGAVVSGQESPPPYSSTLRLVLVLIGAVTAGAAVSLAPARWPVWAIAATAAAFARFGIPEHWDSYRMLVGVLAVIAAAGAVLAALPRRLALGLISLSFLFHYSSIF